MVVARAAAHYRRRLEVSSFRDAGLDGLRVAPVHVEPAGVRGRRGRGSGCRCGRRRRRASASARSEAQRRAPAPAAPRLRRRARRPAVPRATALRRPLRGRLRTACGGAPSAGTGAAPAGMGTRRAGCSVGRGFVATRSTSSSDSSPSVSLTRSGLTSATGSPLMLRPAGRGATCRRDFAQERRALAVDDHRARQRELAALHSRRRCRPATTGAGRRVGLNSVRGDRLRSRGDATGDRVLGQQRRSARAWASPALAGDGCLRSAPTPVGLPADQHGEHDERREPPQARRGRAEQASS